MAYLQIGAKQGITQAIAQKLGINGKSFSVDVWNQVVGLVEAESKQKNIFDESKGKDIDSKDYHSNYVVNEGKVELSDNTWNRICRILGKEHECVSVKSTEQQDTTPSVTQANNLAKAFNLITRGLRDGKLKGVPPEFRSAIVQAYGNVDKSGENTPTVAEYVFSLLLDAQKIMGKTEDINQDMVRRAIGGTVELCPDDDLNGRKCSDYSDNSIVDEFMISNNIKPASSQQAQQIHQLTPQQPNEQLKNYVDTVTKELMSYLETSNIEFTSPGGKKIKGSELSKYLNNINYDDSWGAARADAVNGGIWISVAAQMPDKTNLTKVLLHEALHCAFNTVQDTQEEERLCETQAVKTISDMVRTGKLNDTQVEDYGLKYSEVTDGELKNVIDSWINNKYHSRPVDLTGKVTINGKKIESGDEVYINGQKKGVIGNGDFYLDSPDGKQVYLQDIGNGTTVLSDTDSGKWKVEIKHNGNPVYVAYVK